MSKTWKKLISVGCATCLLVSCIPETGIVLAAETGVEVQSEEAATSGTWGTCEWNLDENGVLTISGGVGESVSWDSNPWGTIMGNITKVEITGKISFEENNISLAGLFESCKNLKEIQGLEKLDTSQVTDMSWMFSKCYSLEELDVSGFDTGNVTNMSYMFDSCDKLTNLNINGFDTSNVTNMWEMFSECYSLEELDVSGFDTSSVTDMGAMFWGCSSLEELDVSGFDTSNVTSMFAMFEICSSLEELDVSGFDTSNVTDMGAMFSRCSSLKKLDVSGFNTSQVTNVSSMFDNCSNLKELDLRNFALSEIEQENWMDMFYDNYLETITIPNKFKNEKSKEKFTNLLHSEGLRLGKWKNLTTDQEYNDRPDVITEGQTYSYEGETTISGTWGTCNWVLQSGELVISGGELNSINKDSKPWVGYLREIKKMTVQNKISFLEETSLEGFFSNLRNIEYINGIEYFDTKQITNMSYMFSNCNSLKALDLKNFDTSQATNMSRMFSNCTSLEMLDLKNFDTSQATNMSYMFSNCNSLKVLDLKNFNTSQATNMSGMFSECRNLVELDVSNFDTSKVEIMSSMFDTCVSLTELDVSNFNTSKVEFMSSMFFGCSITELDLSSFDISNVSWIKGAYIFDYMDLSRIVLPKNMGEQASDFIKALQKGMKPGSWYDVTADIAYESLPDTMQAGHEYINRAVYTVDKNTGIFLKNVDSSVFDENLELITGDVSTDSNFSIYAEAAGKLGKENLLYNIYLQKDGETVQPDGQVQVSIPLPESMRENAKVYYIAEDGTATDMNAEYIDGNLVFVTDHFSVYAVVNSSVLSGDIDGNGKVNLQDSALLRRYLAGWDVTIDKNAADVDGNGKVNLQDSALLRRYLAGWDVTLR